MHSKLPLTLLLLTLLAAGCGTETRPTAPASIPQRIVSIAPSITETLFELGLGDRVVGVTQYCLYPPAARDIPKIGGYVDPNYEAIVSLTPDLVLLLATHTEAAKSLTNLGLRCATVDQQSLDTILEGILIIGRECGVPDRAAALEISMRDHMDSVRKATAGRKKPTVLVVVGRDYSAPAFDQVYISGKAGFHGQLVELAGGQNAYQKPGITYPSISAEGMLHMNPDIILEMVPDIKGTGRTKDSIAASWDSLPGIPAVKNKRVYVFTGHYVTIPGPRVVSFLYEIAHVLHPEVDFPEP